MTPLHQRKRSGQNSRIDDRGEPAASANLTRFEKKLVTWGKRSGKIEGEAGILLEGIKLIEEALEAGHPLTRAWYTHAFAESCPGLIARLKRSDYEIKTVTQRVMRSISDLDTPPGISAVASQPGFIHRQPGDPFSLIVALSKVQDPGNLGGVIRTADYFGADEIWLGPGSVDSYGSKVIRGSMGATFRMPVLRLPDFAGKVEKFRRAGAEVWVAVAHDDNADLNISPSGSRILLIGGESGGLGEEYLEMADRRVSIPGARRSESLNLAVAAGILIYSATSGRY